MAERPAYDPERLFPFGVVPDEPRPRVPPVVAHRFLHPRGGMVPGERVLITGIAGSHGRQLTHRLLGRYGVLGVDRNGWPGHPPDVQMHLLDLRKRRFEDIIRSERPDTIVHYAFVRHFRGDPESRHEVNVLGTQRLLEFAAEYGVKRIVVVSSGYVYGALPENPSLLDEEAPLNVTRTYPVGGRFTGPAAEVYEAVLRAFATLWSTKFARAKLGQDGVRYGPGSNVVTPATIKAEFVALYRSLESEQAWVQNSQAFAASVSVAKNAGSPGRVDALLPIILIGQLRIIAQLVQFRLQ